MDRTKHGELDYYITQMLAGHGCYKKYLHKYKHVEDRPCLHCPHRIETDTHALMECISFIEERTKIKALLNEELTPRVFVKFLLASEVAWNETAKIVAYIIENLRSDEERNMYLNH